MKSIHTAFLFSALLATCISATSTVGAQTSSKALFTDYPPYLCVGGGFVAMAGISHPDSLIVIPIDVNGIETPQTMPKVGDALIGMRCGASHIELLVQDYKSGHPIKLLYAVQWRSHSPTTIREDERDDVYMPKIGPEPAAVDFLEWGGNRAGGYGRGDWYEWVPQVVDRPNNTYEVHFLFTDRDGVTKFAVTLLEETLDKKTITKSVPLVYIEGPDETD